MYRYSSPLPATAATNDSRNRDTTNVIETSARRLQSSQCFSSSSVRNDQAIVELVLKGVQEIEQQQHMKVPNHTQNAFQNNQTVASIGPGFSLIDYLFTNAVRYGAFDCSKQ